MYNGTRLCCIWLCVYVHFCFMILYFVRNDEIKLFNQSIKTNASISLTQTKLSSLVAIEVVTRQRPMRAERKISWKSHFRFVTNNYDLYRISVSISVLGIMSVYKNHFDKVLGYSHFLLKGIANIQRRVFMCHRYDDTCMQFLRI